MKLLLENLEATEALGRRLGGALRSGMVVGLEGPLGAGKTTLVQAIARGLGVPESEYVRSPSFAIVHEYRGRERVYHLDLYRLTDAREVDQLGWEEYVGEVGVALIEWIDRAPELLEGRGLRIRVERITDERARVVEAEARDPDHERLWRDATRDLPILAAG